MTSLVSSTKKIFKFVEYSLKTLGNHHGNLTSELSKLVSPILLTVPNSFSLLENDHPQMLKIYLLWCGWLGMVAGQSQLEHVC